MMRALFRIFLFLACLLVAAIVLFAVIHKDSRPRIYFAAESGDTNALAQYLALGSNVNTPVICYIYGARTAPLLQIASGSGQPRAVDFLLKHGANPNLRDSMGNTPLLSVVGWNDEAHLEALRILLKSGADPEFKSSSGFWTPLISAADLGQAESVKCLLSAGADVHATNSDGLTALHYAQNAEVAKLLIAAGARRTNRAWTETPDDTARRLGHFSALSALTNASSHTNN